MSPTIDFQKAFELSPNPYMLLDSGLRYIAANRAYLQVTASRLEDLLGKHILEVFPHDPSDPNNSNARMLRESFERVLQGRQQDVLALIPYRVPFHTPEGVVLRERYWSATHTPILDEEGNVACILQHTVDVTELQQLKQALSVAEAARERSIPAEQLEAGVLQRARRVQETNQGLEAERLHLRRLFEQAPSFMAFLRGRHHVFEMSNPSYNQLVGHREIIGKTVRDALPEIAGQGYFELLDQVFATGKPFVGHSMSVLVQRQPGAPLDQRFLDLVYQPIVEPDGAITGIFVQGHDITEQKHAQDELQRYRDHLEELVRERTQALELSEAALRQAQKMEAVGRLTGGVAHDFNNLLQVIGGNLQLLHRDTLHAERARERVETALGAVERGARLASQLLAFARRQPLEPVVINLGRLVRGLDDLLRRALGEDIKVETIVGGGLWNTAADPNQLENVILNLAINARDAMSGEGKLTIETGNASLDDHYARMHPDVTPGQYVLLAVSDTGCGMTPEVMERAFEPFFTTKPEGRGTGLGLSMVYGFVKQSGGHVKLYSEVGHGTTIKIYLPRSLHAETPRTEPLTGAVEGGTETILVVEDDADVRATVVELLLDLGYRVLKAVDAQSAMAIIQSGVAIDLLFTDVVMPGPMRSPELARRAKKILPDLEVLFTSGYTENAIVHGGRLDPGVQLLSKPYGRDDLARKLRQLLGGASKPAAEPAPRPTPPRTARPAGALTRSLRILLVEDDEHIRMPAQELLTDLGHTVHAVASAEEARDALAAAPFEVLFTDVSLPGMSGIELARLAQQAHPRLRVIIASGYGGGEPGAEVPGAVLLPKPYALVQIQRALQEVSGLP